MPRRVLSIGQCGPDHYSISRFLERHFDVEIATADRERDALRRLRDEPFDLVLVNRKLDIDYSDGLNIIRAMKVDPDLASIPVMLVSNYSDAQEQAVVAGAEYGFGKSALGSPETVDRLGRFLTE